MERTIMRALTDSRIAITLEEDMHEDDDDNNDDDMIRRCGQVTQMSSSHDECKNTRKNAKLQEM